MDADGLHRGILARLRAGLARARGDAAANVIEPAGGPARGRLFDPRARHEKGRPAGRRGARGERAWLDAAHATPGRDGGGACADSDERDSGRRIRVRQRAAASGQPRGRAAARPSGGTIVGTRRRGVAPGRLLGRRSGAYAAADLPRRAGQRAWEMGNAPQLVPSGRQATPPDRYRRPEPRIA